MAEIGYCTVEDVREVLQDTELDFETGSISPEFVKPAIVGESEWIQETTNRHWYEPAGVDDDEHDLIPTEPLTHSVDEHDVPSSPHSDNAQAFRGGSGRRTPRYPTRFAGPYTRVTLTRRDVEEITELLIRRQDGSFDDWVAEQTEGRGEDYYLQVADHSGHTYLYLHTGTLPRLSDYGAAVIASYEYGIEGITKTVRTATACFAAAHLLRDDESAIGIPDSGQLMTIETKADKLYERGLRLMEIHK